MKKFLLGLGSVLLIFVSTVFFYYVPLLQELREICNPETPLRLTKGILVDIPFMDGLFPSYQPPRGLKSSRPFERDLNLWEGEKERFIADLRDFESFAGNSTEAERIANEINGRNRKQMSSLPDGMLVSISDDLSTRLSFKKMQSISIYWYFSGRSLACKGKTPEAFSLFFGILLLAHLGERSDPQGGIVLNTIIMNNLRRMAASGFVEAVCSAPLPKQTLRESIGWLNLLQEKMLPFKLVVEAEEAFLRRPQTAKRAGTPLFCSGQKLQRCPSFLENNPVFDEALSAYHAPVKSLFGKPYPEIHTGIKAIDLCRENFQVDRMQPEFSQLLSPSRFVSNLWVSFGSLSGRYFKAHFKTLCQLRGVIAVMAIFGFQSEFGRFPDSLGDAEKWAGIKLPLDPYTEKPFIYSNASSPNLMSPGPDPFASDAAQIFLPLPTKTISANQ